MGRRSAGRGAARVSSASNSLPDRLRTHAGRADPEHLGAHRARGRDPRDLPQDPHVRRDDRRARIPRVRARGRGRGDRRLAHRRWSRARHERLLRPPLPGAVSDPHAARRARPLVPSAFTLATTRDHWEALLRARAIENQAFVIAANQIGENAPGRHSGGRSMIVDPWGVVLAQAPDAVRVVIADLDLDRLEEVRGIASVACQPRPAAYEWPA